MKRKKTTNMQIFVVYEVSGGLYCNIVIETVELKLFIWYRNLWQLQIVKNSMPCLFAANDKQFWITYCTMVTNVNWWCCSQINLIKGLIFEISITWLWLFPNPILCSFVIFDTRVFGLVGIKLILFMAILNFQLWVSIKVGSWYYLTCCTSLLFSHFLMCCLTNQTVLELWNYMLFS